jgi:hypothetical protein
MAPYQYSPLRGDGHQIRLLTILPGVSQDEICVDLSDVRLDGDPKPKYEALSYVWGSTSDPVPVIVGRPTSTNEDATVTVTQNLASALVHLRYQNMPRTLWIDAICVNQADISERSAQVAKMGDIYRGADRVVVWLGPEADDSIFALDLLEDVGSRILNFNFRTLEFTTKESGAKPDDSLRDGEREAWALYHLLGRTYFRRLWMRQEIALAREALAVCGTRMMPWTDFHRGVIVLYRYPQSFRYDFGHLTQEWRERIGLVDYLCRPEPYMLHHLRQRLHGVQCMDARDRIYGVLGLLQPLGGAPLDIVPDYSLSAAEVYRGVVQQYVRQTGNLKILRECEFQSEKNLLLAQGLPSWVPDWSVNRTSPSRFRPTIACGSVASIVRTISSSTLEVAVVRVGRIRSVQFPFSSFSTPARREHTEEADRQFWSEIREMWDLAKRLVPPSSDLRQLLSFFGDATCGGWFAQSQIPFIPVNPDQKLVERLLDTFLRDESDGDPGTFYNRLHSGEADATPRQYMGNCLDAFRDQSFVVTNAGLVGLGPVFAREDDQLCVVLGCDLPMIVRQVPNQTSYQIIGPAYVPGINYGEAILGPLDTYNLSFVGYRSADDVVAVRWLDVKTDSLHIKDPRLDRLHIDLPEYGKYLASGPDTYVKVDVGLLHAAGVKAEFMEFV